GATNLDRELVQSIGELVRATDLLRIVGVDKDRRVDVAIAEVAVENNRDPERGTHLPRAANRLRDFRERHREILTGEDAVLSRVRERRRRGEPAARGPQACDVLLILREPCDRGAFAHTAVGVANMPRVPSEPTKSLVRSIPLDDLSALE